MTRENFKKIIKLRSVWKIDKKKGNYELPNGSRLTDYVEHLVETQLKLDNLGIMANGNLCTIVGGEWNIETKKMDDYILMPPFKDNEVVTYDEYQRRISVLVNEIALK